MFHPRFGLSEAGGEGAMGGCRGGVGGEVDLTVSVTGKNGGHVGGGFDRVGGCR